MQDSYSILHDTDVVIGTGMTTRTSVVSCFAAVGGLRLGGGGPEEGITDVPKGAVLDRKDNRQALKRLTSSRKLRANDVASHSGPP